MKNYNSFSDMWKKNPHAVFVFIILHETNALKQAWGNHFSKTPQKKLELVEGRNNNLVMRS